MQWQSQSKRCISCKNFSGALKILYTLTYFFDTFSSAISAMLLLFSHHQPCGHGSSSRHVIGRGILKGYMSHRGARSSSTGPVWKEPCSTVTEINEWSKAVENSSLIKLASCRQDGSTIFSSAIYQAILPGSTATSETTDRLSLNAEPLFFFPSASCDDRFRTNTFVPIS